MTLGLHSISKAQEVSVEKSTFGIQTGFSGVWANNEAKLTNEFVLRSELGLDRNISGGDYYDNDYKSIGILLSPAVTLEPKWYYNLKKRNAESKSISGNSGNYISLKSSFNPDWVIVSKLQNLNLINQIALIPTWGIRRNLGEHFNFETGIGLGFRYLLAKSEGLPENDLDPAINLRLRIGFRFN